MKPEVERTAESYEASLDWWAEQNGKLKQEVEQLRDDHVRTLDKAAAECVQLRLALAFYAEGHFDHGKRARDDLAALHDLQEGRDA